MGLEHSRSGPNDFTPLASEIARGADLVQSALCQREIGRTRQGTLAGRLPRAINVEDEPSVSLAIPQPTRFFLLLQRPSDQIFEKHRAQCLDWRLIKGRKEARKCRAVREAFSPEEGHERSGEGL
jgi:hypothetical protein